MADQRADGERLRLKRHYSVVAHGPDDVELRHGVWNPVSFTVSDESRSGRLHRLVRRLDGSLTPAEIAREEDVPREEVEGLLDHLVELGVVETGPLTALDHYLEYLLPWRADEDARLDRPVRLIGDRSLTEPIAANLANALRGVAIEDGDRWASLAAGDPGWIHDEALLQDRLSQYESWRDAFLVVALTVVDPVRTQLINRICLELRVPWLHAAIDGPFVLVGPLVVPHRSPCFECLERRITMNLRESGSYQRYKAALADHRVRAGELPLQPALAGLLAAHAALEALNYVATGAAFTVGKLLSIYLPTMEFAFHEILRVPGCPGCAPVPERDDRELYFDVASLLGPNGAAA